MRKLHTSLQKKKRKHSSTRWLTRQLNDVYVIKSKAEGYKSRAAYKLLEINKKFNIIKGGDFVLDLGAAPGGWSQVASTLAFKNLKGRVIAVDILDMELIKNVKFMQKDFYDDNIYQILLEANNGEKFDVMLSDMSPNTSGIKHVDHLRIMDICEHMLCLSLKLLNTGGHMVCKLFQGGAEQELLFELKQKFTKVRHFKPDASRKASNEIYLVAMNLK